MITHQGNKIYGYASVFDIVDQHRDLIKRGAFARSIHKFKKGKKIPLLWQHKFDQPVGLVEKMYEDDYGLYVEAKIISSTQQGGDVFQLVASGALNGLSIGYQPVRSHYPKDKIYREIREVELLEISLVTFPANNEAVVTNFKDLVAGYYGKLKAVCDRAIDALQSVAS